MITEDYCSFEIAKLLKEKGFAEPCQAYWRDFENGDRVNTTFAPNENHNEVKGFISMPTHQSAMKWLREVHKINIVICVSGGTIGWWYHIWEIPTHENKLSHRLLRRGEDYPYLSYEEAVEAAIKYCLTKLI